MTNENKEVEEEKEKKTPQQLWREAEEKLALER